MPKLIDLGLPLMAVLDHGFNPEDYPEPAMELEDLIVSISAQLSHVQSRLLTCGLKQKLNPGVNHELRTMLEGMAETLQRYEDQPN